jgi:hypothetical protein
MDSRRSNDWLVKYGVDAGAAKLFLSMDNADQETIRRKGGLGYKNASATLVGRIRRLRGWIDIPDVQPTPPVPASSTKASGSATPQDPPPMENPASKKAPRPIETSFKQCKGAGKGSLGYPIISAGVSDWSGDTIHAKVSDVKKAKACFYPEAPFAHTSEEVEDMLSGSYFKLPKREFWSSGDLYDVVKGSDVLWKSPMKGKRGAESTKTEVFHGICEGWVGDWVIIR